MEAVEIWCEGLGWTICFRVRWGALGNTDHVHDQLSNYQLLKNDARLESVARGPNVLTDFSWLLSASRSRASLRITGTHFSLTWVLSSFPFVADQDDSAIHKRACSCARMHLSHVNVTLYVRAVSHGLIAESVYPGRCDLWSGAEVTAHIDSASALCVQFIQAAPSRDNVLSDDVGITNGGGLLQGIFPKFSLRDGGKQ
jgi:hypothetical protein